MDDNNKSKPGVVETFASDMARAIEGSPGSTIKNIIHGAEEAEKEKRNLSPESRKNKIYLYISLALVFLAATILAFFYINKTEITTVPIEKQFVPIIFHDENSFLPIDGLKREEIVKDFRTAMKGSETRPGRVEGIYFTENKNVVGLPRFIEAIKGNLAPSSANNFDEQFLMGFANNESALTTVPVELTSPPAKDFFMILKVRSTADVFGDMHTWERKMFSDLYGFFGIELNANTSNLLTKDFEDGIMENKNARILRDSSGIIVMMYIYANDHTVVITGTQKAAQEVILRLNSKTTAN